METNRKYSAPHPLEGQLAKRVAGPFAPFSIPVPAPFPMIPPPPVKASCGDLEVDRVERRARLAGASLTLTAREFELLLCLVDRAHRAVRRSEMLSTIWMQPDDGSNVLDVYIRRLRQKLGAHAAMIQTVRGFGYRLRPPPAAIKTRVAGKGC